MGLIVRILLLYYGMIVYFAKVLFLDDGGIDFLYGQFYLSTLVQRYEGNQYFGEFEEKDGE